MSLIGEILRELDKQGLLEALELVASGDLLEVATHIRHAHVLALGQHRLGTGRAHQHVDHVGDVELSAYALESGLTQLVQLVPFAGAHQLARERQLSLVHHAAHLARVQVGDERSEASGGHVVDENRPRAAQVVAQHALEVNVARRQYVAVSAHHLALDQELDVGERLARQQLAEVAR